MSSVINVGKQGNLSWKGEERGEWSSSDYTKETVKEEIRRPLTLSILFRLGKSFLRSFSTNRFFSTEALPYFIPVPSSLNGIRQTLWLAPIYLMLSFLSWMDGKGLSLKKITKRHKELKELKITDWLELCIGRYISVRNYKLITSLSPIPLQDSWFSTNRVKATNCKEVRVTYQLLISNTYAYLDQVSSYFGAPLNKQTTALGTNLWGTLLKISATFTALADAA